MRTAAHAKILALLRWKGYRVPGGDGNTISLPGSKQIRAHFGIQANIACKTDRSLAQIFLFHAVLSGLTPSAGLGRTSTWERGMIDGYLESDQGDLLVLDRDFGHINRVYKLFREKWAFCIRLSVTNSGFAERGIADSRQDFGNPAKTNGKALRVPLRCRQGNQNRT